MEKKVLKSVKFDVFFYFFQKIVYYQQSFHFYFLFTNFEQRGKDKKMNKSKKSVK